MTDSYSAATDSQVLDEIVARIVRLAQPEKIVLFGSAARETAGTDSDIDLLVVRSEEHTSELHHTDISRMPSSA